MVDGIDFKESRKLIETLINRFTSMKDFEVDFQDVSELMESVHKLTFDDVKKKIYCPRDNKNDELYKVVLPVVDEQNYLSRNEYDPLPPSSFYTKLKPNVIREVVGIVRVEFNSFETYINSFDNRYLKDRISFSSEMNFVYDDKQKVYLLVKEKELNNYKNDILSNSLNLDSIKDDVVKEFVSRERELNDSLSKLKQFSIYKQNEILSLETLQKELNLHSKQSIENYLIEWEKVIRDLPYWIFLKFIYSQINWKESMLLFKVREDFLTKFGLAFEYLEKLPSDLSKFDYLSQGYSNFKYIDEFRGELERSLYERGKNRTGYFKVESGGTYDIVENFKEIEKRNKPSEEKYTQEEIENEKKEILKNWNNPGER